MPRHPPCALTNLATKMLASTVQFSRNGRTRPTHTAYHEPGNTSPNRSGSTQKTDPTEKTSQQHACSLRTQQCTYRHHPPPPPVPTPTNPPRTTGHPPEGRTTHTRNEPANTPTKEQPQPRSRAVLNMETARSDRTSQRSTHEHHHRTSACAWSLHPQVPV